MHGAWYRWPHGSVIASSALHIGSRQMQHGSGCVALSGAPRFEMTVLMLAAAAKRDAAALFDALAESGAAVGDDVRKLYR